MGMIARLKARPTAMTLSPHWMPPQMSSTVLNRASATASAVMALG